MTTKQPQPTVEWDDALKAWKVDEQIHIDLEGGLTLSAITGKRYDHMIRLDPGLRYAKAMGWSSPRPRAFGDNYEVAIIDTVTEHPVVAEDTKELDSYFDEENDYNVQGWHYFEYVPADAINAYCERIGRVPMEKPEFP